MSAVLKLNPDGQKLCRICKVFSPLENFSKNAASKDGKQAVCKPCDRKQIRDNRAKRGNAYLEYSKEYRTKHAKDFDYRIQCLLNVSRQRSRRKNRENTLTKQDLIDLFPSDGRCPVFGFILEWNSAGFRETSPSIDRIDSTRGYTRDNVQIISWKANRIKSYATIEEIETVLNYLKSGG